MEILLDSANLPAVRRFYDTCPISGLTTNPSILKKEGKIDFFAHMKELQSVLAGGDTFHVQVVGENADDMLREADVLIEKLSADVYIKVPTTESGLKVMKTIVKAGHNVTATAVYSAFQAFLAAEVGVKYIAPYFNRMQNLGMRADEEIFAMASAIDQTETKIVAASFKRIQQVIDAIQAGAEAVTIPTDILETQFANQTVNNAVSAFLQDWQSVQGAKNIYEL
ncbi:MAG: fructose-6-phosphate aldolase [Bifidobacteriaceae bacterium]|jgi:transaldolase|nr:fructose-6-phosphate aldolase [Bifidobacteriaceae bacterium]